MQEAKEALDKRAGAPDRRCGRSPRDARLGSINPPSPMGKGYIHTSIGSLESNVAFLFLLR